MAYIINRTDGTQISVVEDGTVDQTTTLKLVGKNYAGYGEIQNENFLHLLENFSSANSPPRPISGQIWFDNGSKKLKFYDGTKFRTTGGAEVSQNQPVGLTEGDFWWDTTNNQLYAQTSSGGFVLIGPQSIGDVVSAMVTETIRDTAQQNRTVISGVVNDEVIYIISSDQFTIDLNDNEQATKYSGFDVVRRGLTLKNTTNAANGISGGIEYHGTASSAKGLVINGQFVQASDFVVSSPGSEAQFSTIARFSDSGFSVGTSNDLLVNIENDNEGVISNTVGNKIRFKVKNGNDTLEPVNINNNGIIPSITNQFNIGTSSLKFDTIYATNFAGLATNASNLQVGSNFRSADVNATANTVAVRNTQGDLIAREFSGTATKAKYADLAEKYLTDQKYPTGTVMSISKDTGSEMIACDKLNFPVGVISGKPAYLMNSDADGQAVALVGRVPVRTVGSVKKGDKVYAYDNGTVSTENTGALVGFALESNERYEEKLVECFLKI